MCACWIKRSGTSGDAVALVAAIFGTGSPKRLCSLIGVEYEVLPAVFDIDSALKPGAPLLYEEFESNIVPGGTPDLRAQLPVRELSMGDVDKGFREADVCRRRARSDMKTYPMRFRRSRSVRSPFGNRPTKRRSMATSQAPYMDKVTLYHVFNRQVEIRSIGHHVGGGFGTKFMCWQVQAYAIILARATGRPVKVMFTKEEHMAAFTLRDRVPHERKSRNEKGRNHYGHPGHMVCRYRVLFLYHSMPGGRRLRRTHDHDPVSQLGFEKHHCRHQPECLRRHQGLRRAGTKVLVHPSSEPRDGKSRISIR